MGAECFLRWRTPPSLYKDYPCGDNEIQGYSTATSEKLCQCLGTCSHESVDFQCLLGHPRNVFALSIKKPISPDQIEAKRSLLRKLRNSWMKPPLILKSFSSGSLNMMGLNSRLEKISGSGYRNTSFWEWYSVPYFSIFSYVESLGTLIKDSSGAYDAQKVPEEWLSSLTGLRFAHRVYAHVQAPTISLQVIESPLYRNDWVADLSAPLNNEKYDIRAKAFACIAYFESGGYRINPQHVTSVIALSTRNSIFVAGVVLSDPAEEIEGTDIRRIVGNVVSSILFARKPPHREIYLAIVVFFPAM